MNKKMLVHIGKFYVFGSREELESYSEIDLFFLHFKIPKIHFRFYKLSNLLIIGSGRKSYAIIIDKYRKFRTKLKWSPIYCKDECAKHDGDFCDECQENYQICCCNHEAYEHNDDIISWGFCLYQNCNCQKFLRPDVYEQNRLSYRFMLWRWRIKRQYNLNEVVRRWKERNRYNIDVLKWNYLYQIQDFFNNLNPWGSITHHSKIKYGDSTKITSYTKRERLVI